MTKIDKTNGTNNRGNEMNNQLTATDLDGVKLIQRDNLPQLHEIQAALEHTYQQASQGWGVTREVGVYAFLATELREALEVAATADENFRMLKGAQMEAGRLKKKIEKLEAENLAYDLKIKELESALELAEGLLAERVQDAKETADENAVDDSGNSPDTDD